MVKQRGMQSLGVYQFGRTVRKYLFVYVPIFSKLIRERLSNFIPVEQATSFADSNSGTACHIHV